MRTDADIRRDVESELRWDPRIGDSTIGVVVRDGVVTLTGEVGHVGGKWTAEEATKRVKIHGAGVRSDSDLAEAAAGTLRWNVPTGAEQIQAIVKDGYVTLSGQVRWGYQKISAETAIRNLVGVKGIVNDIVVTNAITASEVKQQIEDAFNRYASRDSKAIDVQVIGSTVTLKGHVRTWQEREDAARSAWATPGVGNVDNQLYLQF